MPIEIVVYLAVAFLLWFGWSYYHYDDFDWHGEVFVGFIFSITWPVSVPVILAFASMMGLVKLMKRIATGKWS